MVHPIFSVLISKPELVMDHVAGYAALVREEASTVSGEVAKRVIAWGIAVLCFIVFLVLAGVAAMLGAINTDFHWVLLAAPGTALALAVAAFAFARKPLPSKAFTELRSQLDADAQALRTLGARS
jgi:peptidoglycan/LPS O-acetylase OafA/YrhL